MKTSEFRKLIREEIKKVLKENDTPFKGKVAGDLHKVIKGHPDALIFGDGKYYSVNADEIGKDLQNTFVNGYDEDGKRFKCLVSNIEFVKLVN